MEFETRVSSTVERAIAGEADDGLAALGVDSSRSEAVSPPSYGNPRAACFHCGEPCPDEEFTRAEKQFCCPGCLMVHDLLTENGLQQFYQLGQHPGARVRPALAPDQWAYLDEPALQRQLLDFTDGRVSRITLSVPAIHCVACVWLLENLFRLRPGIGQSRVNYARREVAVAFDPSQIRLSELVAFLASIGYPPRLTLGELERPKPNPLRQRQWLQLGIAGFAFGNIMLFSIPAYLGLDRLSGPLFQKVFGYLSLVLAVPVLVYSAADYWRTALLSVRQRVLTLDVPIALGLAALYAQSAYEILAGRGEGYLDSLAGLVFFLLCGRAFQQKTHDRIAFDRDYKCFFPLSVRRKTASGEESVALSDLRVGDRLQLRNGELIPADAVLLRGDALIDYSFVTGESEPVVKQAGDYLYAGGQQTGAAIEVETVKAVSQSYLTSLWNHEAFQKQREDYLDTLTNRYSRRFTRIVIAVAVGAALFWLAAGDGARGLKAFTSVLIVACPCALALAAPFALGTAQRLLARLQIYLKNARVVERLAQVDAVVFDKTGTLTSAATTQVGFHGVRPAAGDSSTMGEPGAKSRGLTADEASWARSLASHSTHPHAVKICEWLSRGSAAEKVQDYVEVPGQGIAGRVLEHRVRLGTRAWLEAEGIEVPTVALPPGSVSYLGVDGQYRGVFTLANALRPDTDQLLGQLSRQYEIALLSGDNAKDRERFAALFGAGARLHFNQSPLDKLGFIRELQHAGKTVMMVGDGLNDAGALRQSDVGVAVVEKVGTFSPASDLILEAGQVRQLCQVLELARRASRVVRWSFGISAAYNLVGVGIAAAGILSPIICAVLMPLSSVSVVLFACGATRYAARRVGLLLPQPDIGGGRS